MSGQVVRDAGGAESSRVQNQIRVRAKCPSALKVLKLEDRGQVVQDAGGGQSPGLQKQIRMVNSMVREEQASASAQSAAGEKG